MISGTTRLGGLLGSPVSHSLSPAIHNESFRVLGLDYVYLCFDIGKDTLPDVVRAFREMNVFGFNLTMPVKEAVMALLDELTPAASLIHAVNTVCNENGRLTGYNTDGIGFMRSVREENIMEHSQQVSVIAHALALIDNKIFGGNADVNKTVLLAQYHEVGEVITGDLPTPIKYFNPEIKTAYKDLEKGACERILSMLPEELKPEYKDIFCPTKARGNIGL